MWFIANGSKLKAKAKDEDRIGYVIEATVVSVMWILTDEAMRVKDAIALFHRRYTVVKITKHSHIANASIFIVL